MEILNLAEVVLDYYPPEMLISNAPAIIVCPGGAYATRSGFEGEPVARYFAGAGFHAYVCNYSVGPQARMPHPLHQLAAAVAKARERAGFVAVCGFSAGGHLCAMLSTRWRGLGEALGMPDAAIRPDAAVLGYPPTRFPANLPLQELEAFCTVDGTNAAGSVPDYFKDALCETENGPRLDFEGMSAAYLTGTTHPDAAAMRALSPVEHVCSETPPTFLWAAATDPLVPCDQLIQYFQALRACDVRAALHLFSTGGHGEGLAQNNPESCVWPDMAVRFLLSVRAGA